MFCTRCQRTVPDFLWLDNDHPVLLDRPMVLRREDVITPLKDLIRITAEIEVEMRMCSDVYYVTTNKSQSERRLEDVKPHLAVSEDGTLKQNIPVAAHPYVPGYPTPSS